jgi:HEAT repeat protein
MPARRRLSRRAAGKQEEAGTAMETGDEGARAATTGAGGHIGPLLDRLRESDWRARQEAAFALGRAGREAVAPLTALLGDADAGWEARGHAALALRGIGDAAAVPALLDALMDEAWQVRGYAAWALGALGDRSAVRRLIEAYHQDGNEHCSVRNWIVEALGELGDADAVELLRQAAEQDPEGGVRAAAERALRRVEHGG